MNQFAGMRLLLEANYGDDHLDLLEEVILFYKAFYKALENEKVRTKKFLNFFYLKNFLLWLLNTILLVYDTV